MKSRAALIGIAAVAVLGVGWLLWRTFDGGTRAGPRVVVEGGEAGGLPRAQPVDENFTPAALERASSDAAASGLQVFIVMHHDHIVFDRYGHGFDAQSVIDSGPFAQALVALLAGIAAQESGLPQRSLAGFDPQSLREAIETATHQSYADYLSRRLWRRLNGAPAWIALPAAGAAAPADCCFHARVLDWMRVASLLLDDGRFQTKQLVPPGWVARMLRPTSAAGTVGFGVELATAAHGAEPFVADGVFFLRGDGRWRLWLMPSLKLAVLFGAGAPLAGGAHTAPPWDETRLPNLVMRALSQAATPGSEASQLQRLVPGH
jgi:hypothetical protein